MTSRMGGPSRKETANGNLYQAVRVCCLVIAALMAASCAVIQPSTLAPSTGYEQLQRTEVYREGTVVARTPEGLQVQLAPLERAVIEEKGLAGEVVQEIMDRRGLLPVRILRVYVEGEPTTGGERPRVDITDKMKVVSLDRDRLILSDAPELRFDPGRRLFFKSEKIRVAPVDLTARGTGPAGVSEVILEDLTSILANTDAFTVLERAKIKAILDEHQLVLKDFVDPKTAPRIGRLLGAEAILTGTILEAEGRSVANIRVVDVERGEVILAVRKEFQRQETLPKVVRVIPEDGAKDVAPSLKEMIIAFDQPMGSNWNIQTTPSFFPDVETLRKSGYWRDDRTFVIAIPSRLRPNQTYSLTINPWVGTPEVRPEARFRGLGERTPVPMQRFFFTTGQ